MADFSIKDIKPVPKFYPQKATKEELIAYIEKLEKQLETMNDTILAWIARDKAKAETESEGK